MCVSHLHTLVPHTHSHTHLLQLLLQLLVLRHNGDLGLQVTVNRAVAEVWRADEREAGPIPPPQVIPQTWSRGRRQQLKRLQKSPTWIQTPPPSGAEGRSQTAVYGNLTFLVC